MTGPNSTGGDRNGPRQHPDPWPPRHQLTWPLSPFVPPCCIRQRGFAVPEQHPKPGVDLAHICDFGNKLDLTHHNITSIVWCTGFGPDYDILPSRVLDTSGAPIQEKGIFGATPGLYYAGLPDGNSLGPVGIPANVANGRTIARQVHIDHLMRTDATTPLIGS